MCIRDRLHIDGLMDTADGIGAGASKRLEAMKDSRVGAIGVQSLIIILILQIAAIMKLDLLAPYAFPLCAFWGRLSQIFAIENYEYIFKKESLSFHHEHWKGISKEIRPSLIILSIGIVSALFLLPTNYLIIFILLLTCVSLLEFLSLRFSTLTTILIVCFSLVLFYFSSFPGLNKAFIGFSALITKMVNFNY